MARTRTSHRGVQNKKFVPVDGYKKDDGTTVKRHIRSTPNKGCK